MTSIGASAASRIGASHGYPAEDPAVLQESNNTVVWLRPHPVIAKVGKWRHSVETLVREHAVAVVLAARGAPIAPPLPGVQPTRDDKTDFIVTLWTRLANAPASTVEPADLGTSLSRLHDDLAHY